MNTQPPVLDQIAERFSGFPHLERLILYGSRARGDEEERSDIDLAVMGLLTEDEWQEMQDFPELEAPALLSVELGRLEQVSEKLKQNIQREGVTLHERH